MAIASLASTAVVQGNKIFLRCHKIWSPKYHHRQRTEISKIITNLALTIRKYLELGAPDNRGTEFIIGFMENYIAGSAYQCELFVTTARTTVVSVQVDSPKCSSPTISASFSITAGQVKQLMLNYQIRMTGSAKGSKGMKQPIFFLAVFQPKFLNY